MANYNVSGIKSPNGDLFRFFGKTFYGISYTPSGTQNKTVNIIGFTASDLTAGTRVAVKFNYAQSYNGVPYLNVSNTGNKMIYRNDNRQAGYQEWSNYNIIPFVYDGSEWVIETASPRFDSPYAVCETFSTTRDKTATISNFILTSGMRIILRFTYAQEYNGQPNLNISSSGAKGIIDKYGNNVGLNAWKAGEYVAFLYNGTYWVMENYTADLQKTTNLVTSISSASTDDQYPSAKCMYDAIGDIETLLAAI